MDKIREEFETDDFKAGYKSRDEEIRNLQEQIDYLVDDIINAKAEIKRMTENSTKDLKELIRVKVKNKKLRDALEDCYAVEQDIAKVRKIVDEALKGSE